MKLINLVFVLVIICNPFLGLAVYCQISNTGFLDTTKGEKINHLTIGGYIDAYYGYTFNEPSDHVNPYFVSMNRHNEMTINLAYLDLRYSTQRVRARFVPGFGTYMNANYSSEPGVLKNIVEASVGYKIFAKKEIWLDCGVLGSPYTNESAFSKDHLMYTRSFAPEYVPYYLSGLKLSSAIGPKLNFSLYFLNGWQQIQDQNSGKSIGTQVEYRPNKKNLFNWNTYIGNEHSVSNIQNRMRYFTDVYWLYNTEGAFSITSCAYLGVQEKEVKSRHFEYPIWWQMNFIARYQFNSRASLSGRVEYFSDPSSVQIVPITKVDGFDCYSTGCCFDLKLTDHVIFRSEFRHFFSNKDVFFSKNGNPVSYSNWCISNITVWF